MEVQIAGLEEKAAEERRAEQEMTERLADREKKMQERVMTVESQVSI